MAAANTFGAWRFIKAESLLALHRLGRCQDLPPDLLHPAEAFRHRVFVSHRWQAPQNADPDGAQLAALQGLLREVARLAKRAALMDALGVHQHGSVIAAQLLFRVICGSGNDREEGSEMQDPLEHLGVWYDFSCLPQAPRSPAEEDSFAQAMLGLPQLLTDRHVTTLILRHDGDDYEERAWCFSEAAQAGWKNDTNGPLQFWPARWAESVPGASSEHDLMELALHSGLGLVQGSGPVCEAISRSRRLTMDRCLPALARVVTRLEMLPAEGELDVAASVTGLLQSLGLHCREERDAIMLALLLLRSTVADLSSGSVAIVSQAAERFMARLPLRVSRSAEGFQWREPAVPPAEAEWPIFISYRRSGLTSEIAKWLKEQLERTPIQALNEQWFRLKVFVDALEPVHGDFQAHLVPHLEHSRVLIILADSGAAVRHPQPKRDFLYDELDWWAVHRPRNAPVILETDRVSARMLVSATPAFATWEQQSWLECYWEEWQAKPSGVFEREQERLLRVLRESIRTYGHDIHLVEVRRLRRLVWRLTAAVTATLLAAFAAGWLALALDQSLEESEARSYALAVAAARTLIKASDYGAARTTLRQAPQPLRGWEWRHLLALADGGLLRIAAHDGGGDAKAVAFGQDDQTLVSVGADGFLRVWDVASGSQLRQFCPVPDRGSPPGTAAEQAILLQEGFWSGPPGLSVLALSPDHRQAAAGNSQGRVLVWNLPQWQLACDLPAHEQTVTSLTFGEPGMLLSMGQEGTVKQWDLTGRQGNPALLLDVGAPGLAALSVDQSRLAVSHGGAGDSGARTALSLFAMARNSPLQKVRSGTVSPDMVAGMAYVGRSHNVVVADFQGRLIFVDESNAPPGVVQAVPAPRSGYLPLSAVAASPSGQLLASADKSGIIKLWDAGKRTVLRTLAGHGADVRSLAFSSDSCRLASAAADGSVRIWDVTPAGAPDSVVLAEDDVWALSLNPLTGHMVVALSDGRLQCYDSQGALLKESESGSDNSQSLLTHSPNGGSLLSVGNYGEWMLWEAQTLKPRLDPREPNVQGGFFMSDGQLLLLLTNGAVQMRAADGSQPAIIIPDCEDNPVTAIAPHDCSTFVVSRRKGGLAIVGTDGLSRDTLPMGLPDTQVLAVHSCGRIAAATEDSVAWWKRNWLGGWRRERLIERAHEERVRALAFTPDGRRLVTGSEDQTGRVWDIATGLLLLQSEAQGGIVHSLCFSQDGQDLVVGSCEPSILRLRGSQLQESAAPGPGGSPCP